MFMSHHSLAVRTPASHAGDRSSILRGGTKRVVRPLFLLLFNLLFAKIVLGEITMKKRKILIILILIMMKM